MALRSGIKKGQPPIYGVAKAHNEIAGLARRTKVGKAKKEALKMGGCPCFICPETEAQLRTLYCDTA